MAISWVVTSTGLGGFYDLFLYFMTGAPEGSTESGFMVKPGSEPVTPGLQGIGLSPTLGIFEKTFVYKLIKMNPKMMPTEQTKHLALKAD